MAIKDILSVENLYKFAIGVAGWCGLYFGLKSDVRDNKTANDKDHSFYEYRLTKLEECCGVKSTFPQNEKPNGKTIVFNNKYALAPQELEYEYINEK